MDDRILKFADSKQYLGKIARSGENNTRSLAFDCSAALAEYPTAQIVAVIQRPQGDPYTITPDADGTIRRITLTAYDLEYDGRLKIELRVIDSEKILKSAIYTATVDDSIRGEADAPGQPARERMGVDKAYELIEGITLTEKVKQISRTAEPNGTAYHFRKMYVSITTPQAEEDGVIYSSFNSILIGLAVNCIQSQLTEGGIAQIYANVADGFLDGYGVGAGNQGTASNLNRYITSSNTPFNISAINSMDILATVNMPINTKIKIYGVRA